MKRRFAALRFLEDANISDRVYWYLCEFPLREGERVLAPVGSHDRLQCAAAEKVLEAEEKDAPYDLRLIKRVEAKLGARKFVADGTEYLEFGGVRYDEKRFTRFGRVAFARETPRGTDEILAYGYPGFVSGSADDAKTYSQIAQNGGGILCGEEGEKIFSALLALARGENRAIYETGVSRETVSRLEELLR